MIEQLNQAVRWSLAAVLTLFLFLCSCFAQSSSPDNATPALVGEAQSNLANKNPEAVGIAQNAIAAVGIGNPGGVVLHGQVSIPIISADPMPVVLEFNDSRHMRSQLTTPKGDVVWVVSNGRGAIKQPSHPVRHLSTNNTIFQRALQVPLLSHLSEFNNSNVSVEYVGTAQVTGIPVQVISFSLITPDSPDAAFIRDITRVLYDIDPTTGHVLRIRGITVAENDDNAREKVETLLSDYRVVNGTAIPFRQQTFTDGSLQQDVILNTAETGVSLPDSDFLLPN